MGLQEMLSLVAAMAAEGKIVDVGKASAEVFRQLGEGKVRLIRLLVALH